MPHRPRVSIVIPTHNRAHLLGRALASIVSQTVSDWECLVVDDDSTDGTAELIASFPDPRIRYLRHDMNKGAAAARNTGLRDARGQYIGFLDSDDEWMPTKLERQLERFGVGPEGVGEVGAILTWASRNRFSATPIHNLVLRGSIHSHMFSSGAGPWATLLIDRWRLLNLGGFDERLPASQWWDLNARLSATTQFDTVAEVLAVYHDPGGPRVRTPEHRAQAIPMILEKYGGAIPHRRRFTAHLRLMLGVHHLQQGATNPARKDLVRSLLLFPQARTFGYLMLTFPTARAYKVAAIAARGIRRAPRGGAMRASGGQL